MRILGRRFLLVKTMETVRQITLWLDEMRLSFGSTYGWMNVMGIAMLLLYCLVGIGQLDFPEAPLKNFGQAVP